MWKFWKSRKKDEEAEALEALEGASSASEEMPEQEGTVNAGEDLAEPAEGNDQGAGKAEIEEERTDCLEEGKGSAEGLEEDAWEETEEAAEESAADGVDGKEDAVEAGESADEALADQSVEDRIQEEPTGEDQAEGDQTEEDQAEEDQSSEDGTNGEKLGFFARLKAGLSKTRENIVRGIDRLFSGEVIDEDFYEELEEILIMGDIGVNATASIIERLKCQVKEKHLKDPGECKELLIQGIREQMEVGEAAYEFERRQSVIMVIGVNGVGKTTTVGKLAWKLKDEGKKVLIAAADTFRAAAGEQLAQWAERAGVPMIGGREGADPASVVFDAVSAAKARGVDVLLIDTAGRLHNKKNLMEELRKMNRIIDKEYPDCHRENLIVLDGTTGQNALAQAREFGDVTNLTGIVLTKMDGTAKGGIAVAIQSELQIPVKYIGVGETTQDLQKFHPEDFVNALFEVEPREE